jgi:SAM-dependent methyltransferase
MYFWHSVGNHVLTTMSNMFTNLNLTDMETCYKAFRREVIDGLVIEEDGFGVEPEITAKIAKAGWRIYEVGVSYSGRTYAEGKKTTWRDGVRAILAILKHSRARDRIAARAVDPTADPAHFDAADVELAETLDNLSGADNYADWIFDLVDPHLGERVVEIGAGHGEMTERIARRHQVTALEVSNRCAERLRHRFSTNPSVVVHHGSIESVAGRGPDSAMFDSAVFVNVLEHIDDDLAALRATRAVLRPGGRIVVFAPAFAGLYSDFDRRVGHHRRYRLSELVDRADRAGYTTTDAHYVNSAGAILWWLYARHLRRTPTSSWSSTLFDRAIVPVVRGYEARRRPRFGQSVLLVAERRG